MPRKAVKRKYSGVSSSSKTYGLIESWTNFQIRGINFQLYLSYQRQKQRGSQWSEVKEHSFEPAPRLEFVKMQSTVSFPRTRPESIRDSGSWRGSFVFNQSGRDRRISITNRDVALEVHDLVYGPPAAHSSYSKVLSSLERLYEPNAGKFTRLLRHAASRALIFP